MTILKAHGFIKTHLKCKLPLLEFCTFLGKYTQRFKHPQLILKRYLWVLFQLLILSATWMNCNFYVVRNLAVKPFLTSLGYLCWNGHIPYCEKPQTYGTVTWVLVQQLTSNLHWYYLLGYLHSCIANLIIDQFKWLRLGY